MTMCHIAREVTTYREIATLVALARNDIATNLDSSSGNALLRMTGRRSADAQNDKETGVRITREGNPERQATCKKRPHPKGEVRMANARPNYRILRMIWPPWMMAFSLSGNIFQARSGNDFLSPIMTFCISTTGRTLR